MRAFKPPPTSASVPAGSGDQDGTAGPGEEGVVSSNGNAKAGEQDAEMTAPDQEGGGAPVEEEEEPKERGSDAVERRIEKLISDMRDQGLVDVNDEKAFKEKKVGFVVFFFYQHVTFTQFLFATGCSISRHVPRVFASCVSHMLLLRYRYRSS